MGILETEGACSLALTTLRTCCTASRPPLQLPLLLVVRLALEGTSQTGTPQPPRPTAAPLARDERLEAEPEVGSRSLTSLRCITWPTRTLWLKSKFQAGKAERPVLYSDQPSEAWSPDIHGAYRHLSAARTLAMCMHTLHVSTSNPPMPIRQAPSTLRTSLLSSPTLSFPTGCGLYVVYILSGCIVELLCYERLRVPCSS